MVSHGGRARPCDSLSPPCASLRAWLGRAEKLSLRFGLVSEGAVLGGCLELVLVGFNRH